MLGFEVTLSMFVERFCREVQENHWNIQKTKWKIEIQFNSLFWHLSTSSIRMVLLTIINIDTLIDYTILNC